MSPQLLGTILWIPFALVVLIAGLIYCISGYKKGLWRALGSLGAAVISTAVSVLLARLIAGGLASSVAGMIPVGDAAEIGAAALQVLLSSAIAMVLAMVLFIVLMLILTPVLCWIMGLLLGKRLISDSKTFKWLGMATGLVTALVFALCLLSPVYGTLALAAPVAQGVMAFVPAEEGETAQIGDYISGISNHFLTKASGSGPVGLVYSGLSQVSLGSNTVSLQDVSGAAENVLTLAQQLQNTQDPAQLTQISTLLVKEVRTNFVEQDWFYALSQDLAVQLKGAAVDPAVVDGAYVSAMLEQAQMPKAEFQDLMNVVLGFVESALEKDALHLLQNLSVTKIYQSGILEDLGQALNSTGRIREMKKLTMAMMLEKEGLTFEEAKALLEEYKVGQLTDAKGQIREVEALLMQSLIPDLPPALMVLRHPSLGGSALLDIREKVGFAHMMGLSEEDAAKWTTDKQNALILALMSVSKMSIEELANYNTDIDDMVDTNPGAAGNGGSSAGNSQSTSKPGSSESQKKDKIKDMIESVGISGAKDMLDNMDEEEKEDIKNTLDKMGVDSISDAKAMVDKMEVEEIVDVMESMGFGSLADKMGLYDEELPDIGDLGNLNQEDLGNLSQEDLGNLSKEDLLNMMNKKS